MNSFRQRCVLAFLLWFQVSAGYAAEYETLAVVSGSSVDSASATVAFLGETIQNPRMAENAGKALTRWMGGVKLEGFDPARRWAVALRTDGIDLAPLILLPVIDLPALLDSLKPLLGEVERQDDGLFKIGRLALTGYVRERDGWAFVAQSAERLQDLPDPAAILAETPDDDLLASTLHVRRLPDAYRTMLIDKLQAMIAAAVERHAPVAGAAAALADDQWLTFLRTIEGGLIGASEIRLATRIDQTTRTLTSELRVRPGEGSALAQGIGQLGKVGPKSAAAPRDEALRVRVGWPWDEASRAVWRERLERYAPPAVPAGGEGEAQAVELAEWLRVVATDVIQANECRVELLAVGERPPMSLALRFDLSNRAAVEQAERAWRELAAKQPAAEAKPDDALPGDAKPPRPGAIRLRLDSSTLPPAVVKALGKDPSVWLAVEGQRVALAAGPQGGEAVSRVLARSAAAAPLELSMRSGTCLSLLSQWSGYEALRSVAPLIVLNLRSADDRVTFIAGRDGDDLLLRLTAHEGILRTAAFGLSVGILQVMTSN